MIRLALAARIVLAGLVLTIASSTPSMARPTQTDDRSCVLERLDIGGQDALDTSWRRPVRIDPDSDVPIVGVATTAVRRVEIDVHLAFLVRHEAVVLRDPGRRFVDVMEAGTLELAGVAFGAGLYRVELTTDAGCSVDVWVEIVGVSPFATVGGVVSVIVLSAGLVVLRLALRPRRGWLLGAVGGTLIAVGGLLVLQQFGIVPAPTTVLAAVAGVGALAGGSAGAATHAATTAGTAATGSVGAPGARGPTIGPPPTATPPPPPPPPAAPPPLPPAPPPPPPPAPPVSPPPTAAGSAAPPPPTAAGSAAPPPPTAAGSAAPPPPTAAAPPAPPTPAPPDATTVGTTPERPTITAYARAVCPDEVVVARPFTLTVGLTDAPTEGTAAAPMVIPDPVAGSYPISVQVVADGFDLVTPDGSWRHELIVSVADPRPAVDLLLVATPVVGPNETRLVKITYSIDGQPIGMAVRVVLVVPDEHGLISLGAPKPPSYTALIAADAEPPDLSIVILQDHAQRGRLLWSFVTPHPVEVPDVEVVSDVGVDTRSFARALVEGASAHEGRDGLFEYYRGIGHTVADNVPSAAWDVLRAVAAATSRRPLVSILTEEPYIPWELAWLPAPVDPNVPSFLAAQCTVGRWIIGVDKPALPPPVELPAHDIAVVTVEYTDGTLPRLWEAELEAATLATTYGATKVRGTTREILACLAGSPRADVIHLAMHGRYQPTTPADGLITEDGSVLETVQLRGAELAGAPFVFLNSCQVGSGGELLGDYSGVAASLLYAGAAGVVAPLWSIDDTRARDTAVNFYLAAAHAVHPAEILRLERATFVAADQPRSGTSLAYVFYGHPAARLNGLVPRTSPP